MRTTPRYNNTPDWFNSAAARRPMLVVCARYDALHHRTTMAAAAAAVTCRFHLPATTTNCCRYYCPYCPYCPCCLCCCAHYAYLPLGSTSCTAPTAGWAGASTTPLSACACYPSPTRYCALLSGGYGWTRRASRTYLLGTLTYWELLAACVLAYSHVTNCLT